MNDGSLWIDPGVAGEGCALAYFDGSGMLRQSWFERAPRAGSRELFYLGDLERVGVERPAYQGKKSQGARIQDLMDLCWEGALLAALYASQTAADLEEYTPAEWKGSEPKPAMHRRLWRILTPKEKRVLGGDATGRAIVAAVEKGALNRWGRPGVSYYQKAFVMHNRLDAAAFGAVCLGRLEKL
jgi:hypothetical protein